ATACQQASTIRGEPDAVHPVGVGERIELGAGCCIPDPGRAVPRGRRQLLTVVGKVDGMYQGAVFQGRKSTRACLRIPGRDGLRSRKTVTPESPSVAAEFHRAL